MMDINDDQFELIDSQYEIMESLKKNEVLGNKHSLIYEVSIKPTKNQIDLNIMENQYYQLEIKKKGLNYCKVERRFSEFELIYQILSRKEGGYIFPAFPQNGIFAFMKSKVLLSKDEEFIARRTKMIERFFNKILADPLFDPEKCQQLKRFLSPGKQFEAGKQIQKTNKGFFSAPWTKLKNYFVMGQQNKYSQIQGNISNIKASFESLYSNCRSLIECLKDQFTQNDQFSANTYTSELLQQYRQMIQKHDREQQQNLKQLQNIQFVLFCEKEDLQMVNKIFDHINQLKNNQDNYGQLKIIQEKLEGRLKAFVAQKTASRLLFEQQLKQIVEEIKRVGRISN